MSHGTATFTSKWRLATIQASNSRASADSASGGSSGEAASRSAARFFGSSPRRIAAISFSSRVQPTTSRIVPPFRRSPSIPRAARVSACALK